MNVRTSAIDPRPGVMPSSSARDLADLVRGFLHALPVAATAEQIGGVLCRHALQTAAVHGAGVVVRDDLGRPRLAAASGVAVGGVLALQLADRDGWEWPARIDLPPAPEELQPTYGELTTLHTLPLFGGGQRQGTLALACAEATAGLSDRELAAAGVLADLAGDRLATAGAVAGLERAARDAVDQALHDPLTGLANRVLLFDRAHHAVAQARGRGAGLVVLFCDLDGFKSVNDRLGHAAGDALLVAVAARLRAAVRMGDTLARLGGDEFVVLCEDRADGLGPAALRERIAAALDAPFVVEGHVVHIGVSIGAAASDDAHPDFAALLRAADAAMYQSKRRGEPVVDGLTPVPRMGSALDLAVDGGDAAGDGLAAPPGGLDQTQLTG